MGFFKKRIDQTGIDCIQIPVDFIYGCCAARPPSCLTRCPENKLINISSIHQNIHLLVKVMNVMDNWSGLLADSLTHSSPTPPCLQVFCSPRLSGWPLRPCRSAPSCFPPALAGSCSCSWGWCVASARMWICPVSTLPLAQERWWGLTSERLGAPNYFQRFLSRWTPALWFLSCLVLLCPPSQDGPHIFRLHPGQCCRVWSGWAAGYQAGFFSTGSPRTHPVSPRVPAQCYKRPYTVSTHNAGEYSAPWCLWRGSNCQSIVTLAKCDELALLSRFLLTTRVIPMAATALWLLSPFTPSAIRLVAPSLNSKSWRRPGRPWRSCWRCSWQTRIWMRSRDARNWSRWQQKVTAWSVWQPDVSPEFSVFSLVSEVVPRHLQSAVPLLGAAKEAKD